jgi:hypothetical protein
MAEARIRKCDYAGCEEVAVGGFEVTEDASSFTRTGTVRISETYWCGQHEDAMSDAFNYKAGNRIRL